MSLGFISRSGIVGKYGNSGFFDFLNFLKIFYLREKAGERGRGKERESQAGSVLSGEPNAGLNPTTLGL